MAIDTSVGFIEQFEDFLVTAIADLPEIDIQAVTGETRAVVSAGRNGRLRHAIANSNDDDVGATTFGDLNWIPAGGDLFMEARFFLSSVADVKIFIGFGDSIATADETTFSATTDTITIDTQSDAIGLHFDNDSTTKQVWAVAGAADVVTLGYGLGTASWSNIAINVAQTWGVFLSADGKSARFYMNGKEVYSIDSATVLVTPTATLVPGVWCYEQGTAFNCDVDYILGRQARSTT